MEKEQVRSLSGHFSRSLCTVTPTFCHVHPSVVNVPLRDVWTLLRLLGRDEVGISALEGTEKTFLCGPEVDCAGGFQRFAVLRANLKDSHCKWSDEFGSKISDQPQT